MKKQTLTPAVPLGVSLIFALTGLLRIVKGGLGWSGFTGSVNEYSFHILAGMFFGWALLVAVADAFRRELKMDTLALQIIAILSPILFLITIHQTRNTFNDGPATLGMAAGALIYYAAARLKKPDA